MTVRAKFKCQSVETPAGEPELRSIRLGAVIDCSPENAEFFRWTPSGSLTLGCVNPSANSQFEVGREYYIDISPAD